MRRLESAEPLDLLNSDTSTITTFHRLHGLQMTTTAEGAVSNICQIEFDRRPSEPTASFDLCYVFHLTIDSFIQRVLHLTE